MSEDQLDRLDKKPVLSSWVDLGSKAVALSLILIYGVGYLVTSIHVAASGMVLSNPLKPRVAAAGVLFCFLFGLPIFASIETYKHSEVPVPDWPKESLFASLFWVMRFFQVSCFLAFPLGLIFSLNAPSAPWRVWSLVVIIIGENAVIATARFNLAFGSSMKAKSGIGSLIYCILLFYICLLGITGIKSGTISWVLLPYWIFACGVWYTSLKIPAKINQGGAFATLSVQCLFPIVLFATGVYPHVKSEWGGGQPVDIVVRFSKDSPIYASQKLKLRLVDETDNGLYVLRDNKPRALFIPRSDFAALSFSSNPDDAP